VTRGSDETGDQLLAAEVTRSVIPTRTLRTLRRRRRRKRNRNKKKKRKGKRKEKKKGNVKGKRKIKKQKEKKKKKPARVEGTVITWSERLRWISRTFSEGEAN